MSGTQPDYRLRKRSENGLWEIVWKDPETNKVSRQSCKTRDEIAAKRQLSELILSGDTRPPAKPTVGYLVERYFLHIQKRKEAKTVVPMQSKVARLVEFFDGVLWEDFTQTHVEEYIDDARTIIKWGGDGRSEDGLSDGTIKKDLQILRSALIQAADNALVPYERKFKIKDLVDGTRDTWLTRAQMERVLQCCMTDDREHVYAFLILALATGGRREAVLSLKWDQVHVPEPIVERVENTEIGHNSGPRKFIDVVQNPALDWTNGENMKGCFIDLGEDVGNKRKPKIPIAQNMRVMSYIMFGGDRSQPYVVNWRGQKVDSLKKSLAKVGEEAELPFKLTHHVLKRTCITWLVQSGMSFEEIETLTRTTVATLKKHYAHHSPDHEKAVGSALSI